MKVYNIKRRSVLHNMTIHGHDILIVVSKH